MRNPGRALACRERSTLDSPEVALGYYGNCTVLLRTADNDCQFQPIDCSSCGGNPHECAQLLSGCVWSLRNALAVSEPASYRDTTLHYYFELMDEYDNFNQIHTYPSAAPQAVLRTVAATGLEHVSRDDFESDLSWTVDNTDGLEAGAWERGTPAYPGLPAVPAVDADGSGQCYLTGNVDGGGSGDVDAGCTTLVSPVMDATQLEGGSFLSYHRWFSNSTGPAPQQDPMLVEISDDEGLTWTAVETIGPAGAEAAGGWLPILVRIDEFVEPNDRFRMRVIVSDFPPDSTVEAAIDGVEIRRYRCTSCRGDVTGDGDVDVDDMLAIIVAWGSTSGPADLTGDGIVASEDLAEVVAAWGPCPAVASVVPDRWSTR